MTCLVHNPHYRSLFHALVNELRKENCTPAYILRTMPKKCCTCKDIDNLTLISVLIHDKDKFINLINIINQIDKEKRDNPKLVLSLNRLENFIKENRNLALKISSMSIDENETNGIPYISFGSDDDDSSMDTTRIVRKKTTKKSLKPSKPLKNGTFLYLPYKFEDELGYNISLEAAKKLQRGRFIGRNGYIASLEKEHNICINMITSSTTEQIRKTLENAKAEIGKVTIHNRNDLSDDQDGEWLLVRHKKDATNTEITDLDTLLTGLHDRWNSFLKIRKRKNEDTDDECSNKK